MLIFSSTTWSNHGRRDRHLAELNRVVQKRPQGQRKSSVTAALNCELVFAADLALVE
jgi:hypothetical protein